MTTVRIALVLLATRVLLGQAPLAEPARDAGASVNGAFEGWFKNPDGTFNLLLGYYSRNRVQEVDVPIGPGNRLEIVGNGARAGEPSAIDRGQPTHFLPGRGWGLFAVTVPAGFGDNKIQWTIVANGITTVIPASLKGDYEISPLREAAVGNTPPVLSFAEAGPSVQGPQGGVLAQRTAAVGSPLPLTVWVSDDDRFTSSSGARSSKAASPVTVKWTLYRGPGAVTFSSNRPAVEKTPARNGAVFSGKATTSVTFPQPGEYELHVVANDSSGEGGLGFQCCWTNGRVQVTVH
jgi:hypothetical protein